jgi:hypothetical protein
MELPSTRKAWLYIPKKAGYALTVGSTWKGYLYLKRLALPGIVGSTRKG